jgi:plastocyanin
MTLLLASRLRLALAVGFTVVTGSLFAAQSASAQGYGTIKGRLVWGGSAAPDAALKVKKGDANAKDAAVCAKDDIPNEDYVVDGKSNGVANAFAYITTPKGANADAEAALIKAAAEVEIDQNACRFVPHAVAIHKGQKLVFKSSDAVGHNIRYTSFSVGSLNQMLPPNGKLPIDFSGAEKNPVNIACDIHPWMTGVFMVFDHPFFAVTKADGSFEIKGVPVGTQKLIVRQEKAGFVTSGARAGQAVEVKAGEVTDIGEIKLVPKN